MFRLRLCEVKNGVKRKSIPLIAAAMLAAAVVPLSAAAAAANTTTTTTTTATTTTTTTTATTTTTTTVAKPPSQTKTTKPSTTTTTLVIAESPENSLGSIAFKTSNSKKVAVGKSTSLYITIKDMPGSVSTNFSSSNPSIASIEKVSNTCVKVYGLKDGEVVITASAGGKTAKYSLLVGAAASTTASANAGAANVTDVSGAPPADEGYDVEIDLYSEDNSQLAQYIEQKQQDDAGMVIIGIIGWAAIITACGIVLSVMFKNRTPKMNLYPGSRRRFNTGVYIGSRKKRLLPDQYYRNNKHY